MAEILNQIVDFVVPTSERFTFAVKPPISGMWFIPHENDGDTLEVHTKFKGRVDATRQKQIIESICALCPAAVTGMCSPQIISRGVPQTVVCGEAAGDECKIRGKRVKEEAFYL